MYNKNHLLRVCRGFAVSSRKPSKAKKPDSTEEILEQLKQYDTPLTSTIVSSDSDTFDWKPSKNEPKPGFVIPTKFRIGLNQKISQQDMNIKYSRDTDWNYTYTDFSGLRYPTLDTSRNRNYWKDSGLNRLIPRVFPIKLPTHRKVDPLMREYIYFLHTLDPGRFRIERIAERYGAATISKIVKEFSLLHYIKRNKYFSNVDIPNRLCKVEDKRVDLAEQRLQIKEASYRDNVGYIHTSNEREDHELEYKGDKDTADWVYRQSVIAESMSSFPYPSTRKPFPKRVEVDLTVKNEKHVKVINWIDPTDKVII